MKTLELGSEAKRSLAPLAALVAAVMLVGAGAGAFGADEAPKPRLIRNANGSTQETKPDGTVIITNSKEQGGGSVETWKDGTEIIHNANGSSKKTTPDGTVLITNSKEQGGGSVEKRKDGTKIVRNANGSMRETQPDGTVITTAADGTKSVKKPEKKAE